MIDLLGSISIAAGVGGQVLCMTVAVNYGAGNMRPSGLIYVGGSRSSKESEGVLI